MSKNSGGRPSTSSPKPSRRRPYAKGSRQERFDNTRRQNEIAVVKRGRGTIPVPATPERAAETSDDKIISGRFGGMALPEPRIDGSVPVPGVERVAFFDEIGGLLSEARFLDLCAGTGMMGLEAVSRGAMSVAFVDRKSRRCGQVGRNVLAMEIRTGRCEIFEEEAEPFLKRMSRRRRFWDVVFWDPPFEADYEEGFRFFGNGSVLRPRGAIAVRHHEEMFFSNVIGVLTRRTMIRFEGAALSIYDRMS